MTRARGAFLHGLDVAAPTVEIPDDVTHVLIGSPDLDRHDRLEQHRVGLRCRLLEGHRARDLEGELRGVHLVVGTVGERDLQVDHRVASQHAELGRLLAPRVDRGDVLARDPAAGHLVLELVTATVAAGRLQVDDHPAELAGTAGLLLVRVLDLLDLLPHGLPVGDLRTADVGLDLELPPHAVDQHLEVQLAHAGDDGLAGLLVGPTWKVGSSSARRWIAVPSFSWSLLVLGSIATLMTGAGNVIDSSTTGLPRSHSVSPVLVSFSPITATIWPATATLRSSRLFACIW